MSAPPQPVESAPPSELSAAIDAAARRAEALNAADRELHFAVDAHGELRVEVRDLAGNVLRVIDSAQAMSIMSGLGVI